MLEVMSVLQVARRLEQYLDLEPGSCWRNPLLLRGTAAEVGFWRCQQQKEILLSVNTAEKQPEPEQTGNGDWWDTTGWDNEHVK